MDTKQLRKASKKRRLQIFRDHIFDAENYHFNEDNGKKCLQTQMLEATGFDYKGKGLEPYGRESFTATARFYGISARAVDKLRYAGRPFWTGSVRYSKSAKEAITNLIRLYDDYKV